MLIVSSKLQLEIKNNRKNNDKQEVTICKFWLVWNSDDSSFYYFCVFFFVLSVIWLRQGAQKALNPKYNRDYQNHPVIACVTVMKSQWGENLWPKSCWACGILLEIPKRFVKIPEQNKYQLKLPHAQFTAHRS